MNLIFIILQFFLFSKIFFCICLAVFLGNQADEHIGGVQLPVKYSGHMNLCFVFAIGSYPPYMKIARQRVSATKSGNGLQKTLQTISIWRWLLFILFFLFFCCFGCHRGEKPAVMGFSRQPARQRDSNEVGNGLSFSEWKLHLLRDLHKTVHRFFGRVVGVRCRDFTLPALLSAIFRKHSWIGKVVPPGNALVHYLVDFPDFPLLRLVKGVI